MVQKCQRCALFTCLVAITTVDAAPGSLQRLLRHENELRSLGEQSTSPKDTEAEGVQRIREAFDRAIAAANGTYKFVKPAVHVEQRTVPPNHTWSALPDNLIDISR